MIIRMNPLANLQNKTGQIIVGLKRPAWVSSNTRQDVILMRDASGSMQGQKADDATAACHDLVLELADPINKNAFHVGVIDFSDTASVVHPLAEATSLESSLSPISVTSNTNITAAIREAIHMLQASASVKMEGVRFVPPVALLFSDGCHNVGQGPTDVADELKQSATFVTVAFGDDADENLLKSLATTPQHFYRCKNGRELRQFLPAFGNTLSIGLQTGANTTQLLTNVRQ